MIRSIFAVLLIIALSATWAIGQRGAPAPAENGTNPGSPQPGTDTPMNEKQKVSYAVGYDFGASLLAAEADLDLRALEIGIADGLLGKQTRFTKEELGQLIGLFEKEMQAREAARMRKFAAENKRVATDFLAENKGKEGVVETPSGLQYKILRPGNGPSPKAKDTVRVHYRGTHLDGEEFDSSHARGEPAQFGVDQVIPGWTEALQRMRVGGKWQLVIPPELGYGERGTPGGPIGPNEVLVFEVELLEIIPQ